MPRATFQCPRPHASTGSPATLAGSFGSVSCGVTAPLLWVLVSVNFCLCPPRLEFLLPLILWKSYNQIPLALKDILSGDSQSLCQISRLGSLMWGSETSQQCENFFGITVLQSVGHPPGEYGIWFDCVYTPTGHLLWLLCFWWGVSFLVGSSILLSMVVQQLVAILVLLQEEMSVCPSTPLSWNGSSCVLIFYASA